MLETHFHDCGIFAHKKVSISYTHTEGYRETAYCRLTYVYLYFISIQEIEAQINKNLNM